jgi:phosphopantothenoylcysteine synthetase/decarboxylase
MTQAPTARALHRIVLGITGGIAAYKAPRTRQQS